MVEKFEGDENAKRALTLMEEALNLLADASYDSAAASLDHAITKLKTQIGIDRLSNGPRG